MLRVTHTEAVAVLTVLAGHGVDVAEIEGLLGGTPEVTRRPAAVCAAGDPHECRVFGVTWWQEEATYASYWVCLKHRRAEGPLGPLGPQLPVPRRRAFLRSFPRPTPGRGLILLPRGHRVLWSLADGDRPLADGVHRLSRPTLDSSALYAGAAAEWLHQLLLTHRPWAVLIAGEMGVEESNPGRTRLASIGIEVRTTYVDTPLNGYRDVLRNERLRGALQGVAYAHCPGRVYAASVLSVEDQLPFSVAGGPGEDTVAAFAAAASVLAGRVRQEGPDHEHTL